MTTDFEVTLDKARFACALITHPKMTELVRAAAAEIMLIRLSPEWKFHRWSAATGGKVCLEFYIWHDSGDSDEWECDIAIERLFDAALNVTEAVREKRERAEQDAQVRKEHEDSEKAQRIKAAQDAVRSNLQFLRDAGAPYPGNN